MLIAARYETTELLGSGGMGEVWLARDSETGRLVAVKLLLQEVGAELLERFDREWMLLSKLSHPAVVRVLDRGESEGQVYYTMEHVPWPSLGQRLADRGRQGRRFTLGEVLGVLGRLAPAIDHLHSLGIVHRDMKPSNLLASDDLDIRVIDFGLAGMLTSRMTRTGVILGSMLYLSPEQLAADKTLDPRSDIFQIALICYEMLAGRRACPDMIEYRHLLRNKKEPFTPLADAAPEVSQNVSREVMQALAVDPAARPASAGELEARLRKAAAAKSGSPAGPRRRAPAAAPTKARQPWAHAGAGAVFTILALVLAILAAGRWR